jgi:hypothetical protein
VLNYIHIQTSEQHFTVNMTPNNLVTMYNPIPGTFNSEELHEKLETDAGISYPSPDQAYAQGQLSEFLDFAECVAARKEGRIQKPKMNIDIAVDLVNVIYSAYISAFEEGGKEVFT